MSRGNSGRIVIDIDPEKKRRIYAALGQTGRTLKDWFLESAMHFCEETAQPSLFASLLDDSSVRNQITSPPISQPQSKDTSRYKVVSMFSGCGGMDLGFTGGFKVFGRHYKKLPFDIVWANDLNKAACATYLRNLGHDIHCGDVWQVLSTLPKSADVLVGGFPCQDVSLNGKRAGVKGKRTGLYKAMVEAIKRLKPRVFVAENVKGLLLKYNESSLRQIMEDFGGLGYRVHYKLYQAADYEVPQTRERVFIVGTEVGLNPFVPPEPVRSAKNWMTAKEAIGDIESLDASPEINHIWSAANISPEQGNRRISPHKPAHTIRAECHGNIQFHYNLSRRLSMREAARIQSFPDDFIFEARLRETERQVGNAVPPVLAWHVANAVLKCLR